MRAQFFSLLRDTNGAAAAEMALVTPLLVLLTFAPMELGNYFLSAHAVSKAVRDGARYAGRRNFAEFTCSTASADVIDKTRNIVRTGQLATGGNPRLVGWTSATTITVAVACDTGGTYSATGIYKGQTGGAPVVTVSAAVPYASLFQRIGFNSSNLTIHAQSQSAVMGV